MVAPAAFAETVLLRWSPSPSAGVTGYHVYYGVSGSFTNKATVVGQTSATLADLQRGLTYFFYGTAYNAFEESGPSEIITYRVNSAPLASDLSVEAYSNQSVAVTLLGSDPENDPLTYTVLSGPSHGALDGLAPDLVYRPNTGYAGTDRIVYTVNDGRISSGLATVYVAVVPLLGSGTAFVNGSFESGYIGWIATGNQRIAAGADFLATDGSQVACFNAGQKTPDGVLAQTFATEAGQTYGLSFDVGAFAFNYSEQRMAVTVHGNSLLLSKTASVTGNATGTTKWMSQSFTFVADSARATLTFRDVSPTSDSLDLILDNVRLRTTASSAVTLTSQPSSLNLAIGRMAAFSVGASGSGNLTYQWRFNRADIGGATGSGYTIGSVQASHAGSYDVVVSNGSTTVTSAAATLSVTTPDPGTALTNGSFESDFLGWSQSGYQRVTSSTPHRGGDGGKLVSFNAGDTPPNAILSQSFATTEGKTYVVSCDVGVYSFNKHEQRLRITVEGSGALVSQAVSIFGLGNGSTHWESKSFPFVANSATTTLTFHDVSPTTVSLDLLLDNVQVTAK